MVTRKAGTANHSVDKTGLPPMYLRSGLAALIMLVTVLGHAAAQGGNRAVFIVPEVPVYAEADTAAAAQQIAQDRGRRRAMDILLRRLTAEEDWGYLPDLSQGQPASAVAAEPEDIYDLETQTKSSVQLTAGELPLYEEGFAIFDEKTSSTTYRARITYRFKPESVRRLLEESGLPYSEAQARRALVLPVLETESDTYLWETRNPWARAWLARPLGNELTPLVLPRGDRQDMSVAPVEDVKGLNPQALARLADRYNTPQVILARGRLEDRDGEYVLRVRLIDAYLDGRSGARQVIDSEAAKYDDEGGYGADSAQMEAPEERGHVLAEAVFTGSNDDFPALAQTAVETTVARYARGWKEKTLVDHAAIRPLQLVAWFGSLDEWADIRIALENTPLVRDMEVGVFTNQSAVIDLTVIGQQEQFVLALRQDNLDVWQSPDGRWNIAGMDRAEQLRSGFTDASLEGLPGLEENGQGRDPMMNRPGDTGRGTMQEPPRGLRGRDDGAPTALELPEDIFGPSEGTEPTGPDAGAPVMLEPKEPGQDDEPQSLEEIY